MYIPSNEIIVDGKIFISCKIASMLLGYPLQYADLSAIYFLLPRSTDLFLFRIRHTKCVMQFVWSNDVAVDREVFRRSKISATILDTLQTD